MAAEVTKKVLKTVVFMGSARDMSPPWGGDSRLGTRVLEYTKQFLADRASTVGDEAVTHEVTVLDPLDVFKEGGALATSGGELKHPHFFYKGGEAPPEMEAMRNTIKEADCYVVVTAEYNHSVPPALSSMLGHFGGSNYAYKPAGIITYSVSPFAGMRAAMALRPLLSELGCLPVSALVGFGGAGELFEEDGKPKDAEARMLHQMPKMFDQLEWMALAMLHQRERSGTP